MASSPHLDPKLDLVMERLVDLPTSSIWRAWTTPALVKQWFTPAPWRTIACEIDLRPGGAFRTTMLSPEGAEFPNSGCYLEIIANRKLVWTNALGPGFRPVDAASIDWPFTAMIELEAQGSQTKYTAAALHRNDAERAKHEAMGFHEGWGKALDQLVALMQAQSG